MRSVGADIIRPHALTLSQYGCFVEEAIQNISHHYVGVTVDKYVVMPNHVHMILKLSYKDGRMISAPTKEIPIVVGQMKRIVSKRAGFPIWQKSYHDHIIRDEADYRRIWEYIDTNPAKWREDCYYEEGKRSMAKKEEKTNVMRILEQKNIQVILTRDKDIFMELEERTEIAKNEEADLFLSIHCNYYEDDSSIRGLECYYSQDSSDGKYYAEKLIESLEEKGAILSRNAKPAEYFVLKNTNIPSVLVETGYLSNYADRKDLTSQNYQEKLAAELVEGILKGLRDKKSEPK